MIDYWLFSSSRKNWVGKHKEENICIFCEIAKGNKKIPSKVIYKGKYTMVLMNIYPYNTGHLQVVPIRHVENLEDLNKKEYTELWDYVKRSVLLLKDTLRPKAFNVGINLGLPAGASIKHLHVHIVPRYGNDFGFMEVIGRTKVIPMSIDEVYRKLKKKVKQHF